MSEHKRNKKKRVYYEAEKSNRLKWESIVNKWECLWLRELRSRYFRYIEEEE